MVTTAALMAGLRAEPVSTQRPENLETPAQRCIRAAAVAAHIRVLTRDPEETEAAVEAAITHPNTALLAARATSAAAVAAAARSNTQARRADRA